MRTGEGLKGNVNKNEKAGGGEGGGGGGWGGWGGEGEGGVLFNGAV